MKKLLLSIIFSISIVAALSAISNPVTKPFKIQGGSGTVLHISITPTSTQATSFLMGMPFDIEEDLVQYGKMKDGRSIAKWSMVANTDFKIKVSAGLLTSEETYQLSKDSETLYAELPYIMKFEYSFGYYDQSGNISDLSGSFSLNNETGNGSYVNPETGTSTDVTWAPDKSFVYDILPSNIDSAGLSGSVDGQIYFMFTENSTYRIKDKGDTVPVGDYYAYVTVTLEANQ